MKDRLSPSEALAMLASCVEDNFAGAPCLAQMLADCSIMPEQMANAYNGIGSEAMPEWSRTALDWLHPSMRRAAFIHDLQWSFWSDGGQFDFRESNADFEFNAHIDARKLYGWYDPRRYIALHRASQARMILNKCGWSAYRAAYEAR